MELEPEREAKVAAALERFDAVELRDLLAELVEIPSPTGDERPIAEHLVARLRAEGVEAHLQPIDDRQANAWARHRGRGGGADLLLYAPTDTHLSGDPDEDVPWASRTPLPLLQPHARLHGTELAGLGAENPKAYVACIAATALCLHRAGIELRGDVLVGFGAGGMPTNSRPGVGRANTGQGTGVAFLLEQGVRGDFAVIAKPGWAVSHEEVGLAWFRITVGGTFSYTGIRQFTPFRNAIADAATVVQAIEAWLPAYAAERAVGTIEPQGAVGAIRGGWPFKPRFPPAACEVFVDIAVTPDEDPLDVKRALAAVLAGVAEANPGLDAELELILAIPGTRTDPDSWIVRSAVGAWEHIEGRPHRPYLRLSGATDAEILRMWGLPTIRIGLPAQRREPDHWAGPDTMPMNVVDLARAPALIELLVRVVVDTCDRPLAETRGPWRPPGAPLPSR
ncbi:MAG: hypothetical protein R2761_19550 [Acidimicrobiales bacterium]